MDLPEIRHIAEGFRTDLLDLMEDYSRESTFDYKVFAEIWKKRMFTLVYWGRENESELFEFTQQAFYITLGYLTKTYPIHRRTAALYALYGLYIKQRLKRKCKIRVTQEQWLDLMDLYEFAKTNCVKHLVFVILKLMKQKPFHFVAFNKLMGPKSTMTWDLISEESQSLAAHKQSLANLSRKFDFEHMSNVHEEYESKFNAFAERFHLECSLDENKYLSIKEDFQRLMDAEKYDEPIPGPSSANIGNRRLGIKMKQFSTQSNRKVDTRRKELLCENNSDSDASPGPISEEILNSSSASARALIEMIAKRKKKRRVFKRKTKKIGRPRKFAEDEPEEEKEEEEEEPEIICLDVSEIEDQKPFEKPRRLKRHYESPKNPKDPSV